MDMRPPRPAELPRFIRDMMAAPPRHGEGVHRYLFRLARVLHAYRTEDEIVATLAALTVDCGRHVPDREITEAVRSAKQVVWNRGARQAHPRTGLWPTVNEEQLEAVVASRLGLVDLWERSPVRFERPATADILDTLFPGNPLLCCGWSKTRFHTRLKNDWTAILDRLQLIVPSPMSKPTGLTKEGRVSPRSLDNTGLRRFLVVEFDRGEADEHAAILLHLACSAPLALAVHSGNKSLHGWFYCNGLSDDALLPFMTKAVSLGADPATWGRSQLVRIPDSRRDNGRRQTVFFFNPEVIR